MFKNIFFQLNCSHTLSWTLFSSWVLFFKNVLGILDYLMFTEILEYNVSISTKNKNYKCKSITLKIYKYIFYFPLLLKTSNLSPFQSIYIYWQLCIQLILEYSIFFTIFHVFLSMFSFHYSMFHFNNSFWTAFYLSNFQNIHIIAHKLSVG